MLDRTDVKHWSNVESVMRTFIEDAQYGVTMSPHRPPRYPSTYGYRSAHSKRKFAINAAKNSLFAFQHMLAYCSYTVASAGSPPFSQNQHRSLYECPARVSTIFENFASEDSEGSHILLKLLWSSLGEIRQTRNFTGVVVTYVDRYDLESVQAMHSHGVPVYVSWSHCLRLESYSSFLRSDILTPWRPPPTSFTALNQPQRPASTPTVPPPPPPPFVNVDKDADTYPLDYVEGRKAAIESTPNKPQRWLGRENSAKSFRSPGKHGASVFQFIFRDVVDEKTGKEMRRWERIRLTRSMAEDLWTDVSPCNLW